MTRRIFLITLILITFLTLAAGDEGSTGNDTNTTIVTESNSTDVTGGTTLGDETVDVTTDSSTEDPQADQSTDTESEQFQAIPRRPKDEFNITESSELAKDLIEQSSNIRHLETLKHILLRLSYQSCCPSWSKLVHNEEIQEELKSRVSKLNKSQSLKTRDLLNEVRATFVNVTYMSIDGQSGENEREKYYKFIDSIQYYLRLLKVADGVIADSQNVSRLSNATLNAAQDTSVRAFKRQLKSIQYKISQDPLLSSFMKELFRPNGRMNSNFDYYEDFLRFTTFGQLYAKNISMIRESVDKFDRICGRLLSINFTSTLTRPSIKYNTIRKLSLELYSIRNQMERKIAPRVLSNRQDVARIFKKLDTFSKTHSYIRMLGDEFNDDPSHFSDDVSQLAHLLDQYMNNNMTEWVFYDKLAELPEDFIRLGSTIAHEFETREIPAFSRFDSNTLGGRSSTHRSSSWMGPFNLSNILPSSHQGNSSATSQANIATRTTPIAASRPARNSSLLSMFFS